MLGSVSMPAACALLRVMVVLARTLAAASIDLTDPGPRRESPPKKAEQTIRTEVLHHKRSPKLFLAMGVVTAFRFS
jgi:hypothetical protein